MTRVIDAVVFDVGGVLIEWDPRHLYRKLLPDEADVEWFLANVCTPEWNSRQDAGRSFAEGVEELTALHPDHDELIRAYADRWEEMLAGAIAESVELLEDLHAGGVPLYGLTNFSAETFPVALARFPFLERLRGIVVSGHEGVVKPDPAIFRVLLEQFGLEASDCVFLDDSKENVRAAASLGFVAERFTTAAAFKRRLTELGVALEARPALDIIARSADREGRDTRE